MALEAAVEVVVEEADEKNTGNIDFVDIHHAHNLKELGSMVEYMDDFAAVKADIFDQLDTDFAYQSDSYFGCQSDPRIQCPGHQAGQFDVELVDNSLASDNIDSNTDLLPDLNYIGCQGVWAPASALDSDSFSSLRLFTFTMITIYRPLFSQKVDYYRKNKKSFPFKL